MVLPEAIKKRSLCAGRLGLKVMDLLMGGWGSGGPSGTTFSDVHVKDAVVTFPAGTSGTQVLSWTYSSRTRSCTASDQMNIVIDLALPVGLIFFSASSEFRSVLKGATGSETNNAFFEVQRCNDGIRFERIGIVENGSSLKKNYCEFID